MWTPFFLVDIYLVLWLPQYLFEQDYKQVCKPSGLVGGKNLYQIELRR